MADKPDAKPQKKPATKADKRANALRENLKKRKDKTSATETTAKDKKQ